MPDIGHVGGAAGQHPAVGRGDMGVGPEHRGHPAVEVPSHRDLLAGQLGVEVDEDRVGLPRQLVEQLVDRCEGVRSTCRCIVPLS